MNVYRIETRFTEYPYGGLTAASRSWFVSLLMWLIFFPLVIMMLGFGLLAIVGPLLDVQGIAIALPVGAVLFVLSLPLLVLPRTYPRRIVFDPDERKLYLLDREDTPLSDAPTLSYDAIHHLEVKREVSNNNNRRHVRYQVELLKTDLSTWKLFSRSSRAEAEAIMRELIKVMGWTQPDDFSIPEIHDEEDAESIQSTPNYGWSLHHHDLDTDTPPPPFEIERETDYTRITWKRPSTTRRTFGINLCMLSLACICVGGIDHGGGGWGAALIASLILSMILKAKAKGDEGWVKIATDRLTTQKTWHFLGSRDEASVDNDTLVGVGFGLERPEQLKLITREHFEVLKSTLRKRGELDLGDIMRLAQLMMRSPSINTLKLSASEVLLLEALIEREFERITGRALK